MRLGPDAVAGMAQDMGVSSIADQKVQCSWVLGSGEVSVMDMAAAYSTLANEGIARTPIVVTRVEFPDGTVRNYEAEEHRVLTPEQAARVTFALQQVIQGGTGREANFGRPAAGKTGTTQNNADGWFVGYTPTLTAAVWMGFPEGQVPMRNVHGMSVQGGNFPARIWNRFMKAATLASESVDFPEFDEKVLGDGEALDATLGRASVLSPTAPSSSGRPSATTAPSGTPTTGGTATTDPTPTTAPSATTAPPTTSPPPTTAPGAAGGADPPQ